MNPIFTKLIEISLNYDSYDEFLLNAVKKDLQNFVMIFYQFQRLVSLLIK